jgi:glycosyltransferase involved in cell wall biosynthesis
MTPRRIAFVVQRYGLEVSGGAELHCRWLAEHLNRHFDIEVLTTCAVEYQTWSNYYSPGTDVVNGVRIRRFAVDQLRESRNFQWLTARLLATQSPDLSEQINWMKQQGPNSSGLLRHIASKRDAYDAFIFFTYLYSTTYYGIQLVPEKALLVPTAHDEPAFHLDIFRTVFNLPRFIVYNTETERKLVQQVMCNSHVPSAVVGTGIDVPADVQGKRFRLKYGLQGDLLVYVGRVDASKNVQELFEYFLAFRACSTGQVKLVVMGKGAWPIPPHPDIVPLGHVSEQDKFDGLQAASVLLMPSKYESLSMAVLEAWRVGTPVLVNGACEVLREQCRLGHGGLWCHTQEEFTLALRTLLARSDLRARLAASGQAFAEATYSWENVERRYLEILQRSYA